MLSLYLLPDKKIATRAIAGSGYLIPTEELVFRSTTDFENRCVKKNVIQACKMIDIAVQNDAMNPISPRHTPSKRRSHATVSKVSAPPSQNVAFAINYLVPSVDQFLVTIRRSESRVELTQKNTKGTITPISGDSDKDSAQQKVNGDLHLQETSGDGKKTVNFVVGTSTSRKSKRGRKPRSKQFEKSRVRYDMNLVPLVAKNPAFVRQWREEIPGSIPSARTRCGSSTEPDDKTKVNRLNGVLQPFEHESSVVWVPSNRTEWEDCLSEMTAVCTSAALRRHVATEGKSSSKPFYAPLSKDYIRDRVDIDDPLFGYQIRRRKGGWLQGFILFTNFTTWTHFFKWDSLHEMSGLSNSVGLSDADGSLAAELEGEPRSGDPLEQGVVFSTIAEISLLGGLGCGEYLLRMALDDIANRQQYKYVVLQATDASRTFYEKFGFVRVGAISRYGPSGDAPREVEDTKIKSDIVGYRHWTYAHESESSLGKHGGPSYMMALRLSDFKDKGNPEKASPFIVEMNATKVDEKPHISQLGGPQTPHAKRRTMQVAPSELNPIVRIPMLEQNGKVRPENPIPPKRGKQQSPLAGALRNARKKRQRVTSPPRCQLTQQRETLMTPPPAGTSLSYQQKQYQSVWLAVPPKQTPNSGRKPPKERRLAALSSSGRKRKKSGEINGANATREAEDGVDRKDPFTDNFSDVTNLVESRSSGGLAPGRRTRKSAVANCAAQSEGQAGKSSVAANKSKTILRKQRILSIPKWIPKEKQFFNKVVKPKTLGSSSPKQYFFVLQYDPHVPTMKVVPLEEKGELGGKRSGRPRWKALGQECSLEVESADYSIVPAYMVTKTPNVASETWDILEE